MVLAGPMSQFCSLQFIMLGKSEYRTGIFFIPPTLTPAKRPAGDAADGDNDSESAAKRPRLEESNEG